MRQQALPKKFFRDNPLQEISAAQIARFTMSAGFDERIENFLYEETAESIDAERLKKIELEKDIIAQINDAEAIIKLMRGDYDVLNRTTLSKKALTIQDACMPLLLRRLKTSFQDAFIECAVTTLAHADDIYIENLKTMYKEIRNPYVQSLACLVFAIREKTEMVPMLREEYERLQKDYPDESYDQGPLLALYILHKMA